MLLRAFRAYGEDTAHHLSGPFAWTIWDGNRHRLTSARDRLGTRCLYFAEQGSTALIAEKLDHLLRSLRSRSLNLRSIWAHLHGEPLAVGETFYEEVRAVPPGAVLTVAPDRIEVGAYWSIKRQPMLKLRDEAAYAAAFRELFLTVVSEHAAAGSVGVTLSGGLDSTSVAAALRQVAPRADLIAFSWIAPELPHADETEPALAVCQALDCRPVPIRADQHWPLSASLRLSPASPFIGFYTELWEEMFRCAREQGVRLLMSGFSGDHLVGGNVFSYPDLLLTGRFRRLASELRTHLPHSEMGMLRVLRHLVFGPAARLLLPLPKRLHPVPWLGESLHGFEPPALPDPPRSILPGRRQRLMLLRDPWLSETAVSLNAHAAEHDIDFRHPWLDHRLVEFAASLPTTQTFAAGVRKIVLRRAMRGLLPDQILDRRGKIYPLAIFHRGLRERERAKVWELTTGMRAAELGFVDERRLREAYDRYLAGATDDHRFWHALTLEAWLRRYFA